MIWNRDEWLAWVDALGFVKHDQELKADPDGYEFVADWLRDLLDRGKSEELSDYVRR